MHQHGPTCLEGPVSRKRPCWLLASEDKFPKDPPPPTFPASPSGEAPMRLDLIARVRQEIAEGTYDTPEKWEKALDQLLDELDRD